MTDPIERIIRLVIARNLKVPITDQGKDYAIARLYRECSEKIAEEFEQWKKAQEDLEEAGF